MLSSEPEPEQRQLERDDRAILAAKLPPCALAHADFARPRVELLQVSDAAMIGVVVDEVLALNVEAIERFRAGEDKVLGFLVGQVMRSTGGKADPKLVNTLLRQRLS